MSTRQISASGPLGVATTTRRSLPARLQPRRLQPVPTAGSKTQNRTDFHATGPQAPASPPVASEIGPHPVLPPAPDAGFEALMQFTLMLEQELDEAERRALAHGREWQAPFVGAALADRKS